ncbi:MAG: bifunctional DNA-formamidopyrimidine glycosylase/DNA-(apurinic or apyrimidinic site) lyase [Gemmatimonadaceae bacterium]|nr:bifunctional DNA-formamidopyrimidine glycosylase/DNA-(apurinic or apyrimidinic site) lyase [Gemmatimonadaceae bacterium]MCW5826818.1 bifunctional DNA-formamidopyrimidine glycosylase/DNA-(apurinic or apyrimidinic site) lyase [Gemmatimonadaceae bacterium]
MPELPETETIARDLDAALRGARIRTITVLRGDVVRGLRPITPDAMRRITRPILGVSRRAKSIVIALDGAARIVVTPRFTGALLLRGAGDAADTARATSGPESAINVASTPQRPANAPPPPLPYCCVQFRLSDARLLEYVDVRRLGTLELMPDGRYAAWDASLGPEPLDPALTPERFSGILRGSSRAVKSVLMDQKRLAGVGNIYANEALWRAGIRPSRRASAITRAAAAGLLESLREILRASIALRGTTFRDFQDAYGGRGGYAKELKVYGRGGEACVRCGATLQETHKLEGRSTVWCRSCQK